MLTQSGRKDEEIKEFNSMKNAFLAKKGIPKDVKIKIFKKVPTPVLTYESG